MSVAYVDTSVLAAIALGEPDAAMIAGQMAPFARLISSNLLEAELRAAFRRESVLFRERVVESIEWILPDRPLASEFEAVLEAGYLRGADLWHVATALYVSPQRTDLSFLTLDVRQGAAAKALGFQVPWYANSQ